MSKDIVCTGCRGGVEACESRAGWPIPSEAKKMLDAGLAMRMMLDYWASDGSLPRTEIVCPAEDDRGGGPAAGIMPGGRCTFLKDDLCEIHNSGYKPLECRVACCKKRDSRLHLKVAKTWNNEEGRAVVEEWKKLVNY